MSTERTKEINAMAGEWLVRRDSDRWTDEDQLHLEHWLAASVEHRVAFLRLELAWEEAARLKALGAGIQSDTPPPPGQWNLTPFFEHLPSPSQDYESLEEGPAATATLAPVASPAPSTIKGKLRARVFPWALAAGILLAVATGGAWYFSPTGDRYVTPIGTITSVPIKDGSNVTLNTNTKIFVSLTAAERRIDLAQGEAYFEVARDPSRPFVVHAGNKRVIAVGTRFSVRRDGDDIHVLVTDGRVRLDTEADLHLASNGDKASEDGSPRSVGAGADFPLNPPTEVILTPGAVAIARADEADVSIQRKTLPEAEEDLSWRQGILTFRNQSLSAAIAEFNRYNARQIIIGDPAVARMKIEGNFRATNVDAFVRLLENGFPIQATEDSGRIVLTYR